MFIVSMCATTEGDVVNEGHFEGHKLAILVTTPTGILTSFNENAERLLGFKAQEVVGKLSPVIFHDPDELRQRVETFCRESGMVIPDQFGVIVGRARSLHMSEERWTYVQTDPSPLIFAKGPH
jgi:PAS domain S-box-containing protein